MKRIANVVIGAGFGDEGKGLMVDYLASKEPGMVVRFSGGANAGHTVVTPDGLRHVFSHFGSGAFANAGTYLSRYFVAHPLEWRIEADELVKILGFIPQIVIAPDAMLTTPYDVALNRIKEQERGAKAHGSTGCGLNETVNRCTKTEFGTSAALIFSTRRVARTIMFDMRDRYLRYLVNSRASDCEARLFSDETIHDFLDALEMMQAHSVLRDESVLDSYDNIIFEGSQGLLLDEFYPFFPHVTRARTGLHNAVQIAQRARIDALDVTYMIRAYLTRHGNGPLPGHEPSLSYEDDTNNPNTWQGAMRFAPMDIDLVKNAVAKDYADFRSSVCGVRFCVTHCDQVETIPDFYHSLESWGPTRNDIREKA